MKFKWFVFATLVVAVKSASVFQKGRNIPVKVVYEKSNYPAVRNVEIDDVEKASAGIRNLEEKQQLSENELRQATKIVTPNNPQIESTGIIPRPQPELLQQVQQQVQTIAQETQFPEQNIDDIYDKIQEIILSGSKNIKQVVESDDKFIYNKEKFLEKVNSTLENFLANAKKIIERRGLKQSNQNPFQILLSNFQQAASNIFSGLTNPGGQGQNDEPGANQNPIQQIFNQIQSSIQQLTGGNTPTTQSTVLGDSPTTAAPSGPVAFFQTAVQTIQQGINNLIQGSSTPAPGSQSDEQNNQGNNNNPIGFIQNAIQSIGIPNPFQPQTQAPGAQGDSPSTTPSGPLAFIQNAVNAINPFNQPSTQASAQSDTSTASPASPPGGIQGAIANATNAIPNNPASGIINQISSQVSQQAGNLPGQEVINQVAQQGSQISQNIPGQDIVNQVSQAINQQAGGTNPIEAGQNIVTQIAGAVNPGSGGNIPGQEIVNQIVQSGGQSS